MKPKNYPAEFISGVQHAIDEGKCEIENLLTLDDMPKRIKINGITINLLLSDDNLPSTVNNVSEEMSSEDFQKWVKTATGRFYSLDWRRIQKNPDIYKSYKFLSADLGNGIHARMIIRKITESDVKKLEDIDDLTDIVFEDCNYAIIKAYSDSDESDEFFNMDSIFEEKSFSKNLDIDQFEHHIDIPDNDEFADIPDSESEESESEELF